VTVTKEHFVVDENGTRTAVLLDLAYYQKLVDALEEFEAIRAYDEAKASGDEVISFQQALTELEEQRRK
jgi:hypothetical protein